MARNNSELTVSGRSTALKCPRGKSREARSFPIYGLMKPDVGSHQPGIAQRTEPTLRQTMRESPFDVGLAKPMASPGVLEFNGDDRDQSTVLSHRRRDWPPVADDESMHRGRLSAVYW